MKEHRKHMIRRTRGALRGGPATPRTRGRAGTPSGAAAAAEAEAEAEAEAAVDAILG